MRDQGGVFERRNILEVDFDEVCKRDERLPCVTQCKVIQSHGISLQFEPLTCPHHLLIGGDAFLDFNHHLAGGQQ